MDIVALAIGQRLRDPQRECRGYHRSLLGTRRVAERKGRQSAGDTLVAGDA